jgi:hypothetical protein
MNSVALTVGKALVVFALVVAELGCGGVTRPKRDAAQLMTLREEHDQQYREMGRRIGAEALKMVKAEDDDYAAGRQPDPPVLDLLLISGGGDWGAFGAGFLRGWKSVPKSDPLAMPEFDAVTGVSTGALIAPFAFVGTDESLARVEHLYRNPRKDWVKQRGMLYFLPNNISFAEVPGLERELKEQVTMDLVRQIAERGKGGRFLAVNATNLDDARPQSFNLVWEAQRAVETGDLSRIHKIMLASAGIPGAFPYRDIDGDMYVDGGVTSNILYGGRGREEDSLQAVWSRMYPDRPIPKLRFWILFNNQLRTPPQNVNAKWPDIVSRSLELSTRSATLTAIRHLHANAEITRLKRKAEVEVRLVSVPDDWVPPKPGVFIKETMNDLADVGLRMGADPSSWSTEVP